MKNTIFITLFTTSLLFGSSLAYAEYGNNTTVTPFYGHQFGGHINTYQGELQIKDTENMGFSVDIPYAYNTTMQFLFITQDTSATLKDYFLGTVTELFDLTIEYYQIGGTTLVNKGNVTTFFSGSLGATIFDPKNGSYSDESLFSMTFGYGIIKELSKRFLFQLQGRLLLPIQTAGGSIFCSNSSCSIGVSGGTSIVQADVTVGLQFKF